MLNPEEFVRAGDYLVYHCPTWSWAAGEAGRRKAYLPPEKQFLVTRNGELSVWLGAWPCSESVPLLQCRASGGANKWPTCRPTRSC